MIAYVRDGAISLVSRYARDWTKDLPFLAADFHRVTTPRAETFNAIFDGEVALLDERGVTSVPEMLGANTAHLVYYAFDLLWWDDRDLRTLPLEERKAALRKVLTRAKGRIVYSDHVQGPKDRHSTERPSHMDAKASFQSARTVPTIRPRNRFG